MTEHGDQLEFQPLGHMFHKSRLPAVRGALQQYRNLVPDGRLNDFQLITLCLINTALVQYSILQLAKH